MGSGFKNFTSTVLTAADLNNYCQNQSIMYFSSTGARDTQITGPVDGMTAYIGSNDANEGLYSYNGTSWRKGPGWNAPWGFISYTEVTANVATAGNVALLTASVSVIANRRYQILGQIPGYFSSVANNSSSVQIQVSGTSIAEARVWTSRITSADIGATLSGYYAATATNASLGITLYSTAIIGANHQYIAAATKPISLLVQDIGPSGAPV